MAKLGYTWYAKDWRANMDVSELTLQEKGFYRELIDECFIKNSSKIQINERTFCRLHGINSRTFTKVLRKLHESLLIVIENFDETIVYIPSTSKRLGVIESASEGGKKSRKKVTKFKENIKEKSKEKVKEKILNSQSWIESFCMNKKIRKATGMKYLNTFLDDLELKDDLDKGEREIKSHFINWLSIQLKNKSQVHDSSQPKPMKRTW